MTKKLIYTNKKTSINSFAKNYNPGDFWHAERCYKIPAGLLKTGRNTISIRVNDFRGAGGINKGPVMLYFEDPDKIAKRKLTRSPYLHEVNKSDDPYVYRGW